MTTVKETATVVRSEAPHGGPAIQRDLTPAALAFGLLLTLVMAAANMYLAIKAGLTISANIPCSVAAAAVFSTAMRSRHHSIAEANVAQATGSVGEGLAAGVVFVIPALVLSHAFPPFDRWHLREFVVVTGAVLAGGLLGIVLASFLRRPMVEDAKDARFPEAIAAAETLKMGMGVNAAAGAAVMPRRPVVIALLVGVAAKIFSTGVAVLDETLAVAFRAGSAVFQFGAAISPALIGVGFIIEFNAAILVAIGGVLSWELMVPAYLAWHPAAGPAAEVGYRAWSEQIRYVGVGGMIVGGIYSLLRSRRQIATGLLTAVRGARGAHATDAAGRDRELGPWSVWALVLVGLALAAMVFFFSSQVRGAVVAIVYTAAVLFFLAGVSIYIVGLIGSSNQPVSGIALCGFLLGALCLAAVGLRGPEAVRTSLLVAAVACLAVCISANAAQNFRTTSLIGGSPRGVQIGLVTATVVAALASAPLLVFLGRTFRIGAGGPEPPQAAMFSALATGLFTAGASMPWAMIGLGIVLGTGVAVLDSVLASRQASFRTSPLAIAVGMYLPLATSLSIAIGGIAQLVLSRRVREPGRRAAALQAGTLVCAGLVAGEALTGIVLAVPVAFDVTLPLPMVTSGAVRAVLSLAVLALLPAWIYRTSRRQAEGA